MSSTTKSIVPSPSSYVALILVSVLLVNIAPTMSCICSSVLNPAISEAPISAVRSIVPSPSWYTTEMFASVFPENIAPTISWIFSSVKFRSDLTSE